MSNIVIWVGTMLSMTLLSYILFLLSLFFSSFYPALIVAKAFRSRNVYTLNPEIDKLVSIVIPSKNEPMEIALDRLSKLSNTGCYDDVVLVLDDELEYVCGLVKSVEHSFFSKGVIVARFNGFGGRNGALTDGALLALGENIAITDIDATPTEEFLCDARKCEDVCVGVWRPYVETRTRIEEGMAYVTRLGSWIFYELKSRAGLFIYPLGAGTVIDKNLLKSIGFWRFDVIQDDIWLGYELMYKGVRPKLINKYVDVGVPKTLSAARIQQCRWSYGALNVVSRFISKAVKAPMGLQNKVEAIIYSVQPTSCVLVLISLILAFLGSIVDREVTINIALIAPILVALSIQSLILDMYGSKVLRLGRWKRLCLTGRASSIYTLLSPLLGYYALKGLLRIKYRYRITPKNRQISMKQIDIAEITALALSLPVVVFSLVNRNIVTLLIAFPLLLASIYSLIRLEK